MKNKFYIYSLGIIKCFISICFLFLVYVCFVWLLKNLSDIVVKNILEYIKVLAWPLIILLGMLLFKTDISDFLGRIIKGKLLGAELEAASPTLQQEKGQINSETAEPGEAFQQILSAKEVQVTSLKNSSEQLIDSLTKAEIELDFERIYNFIFANQIDLLNQISKLNAGEVAFEYVIAHFAQVQQLNPGLSDWNASKYLDFLLNNKLIENKTAVGSSFITVALTLKGKAFIAYVTARDYKKYGL